MQTKAIVIGSGMGGLATAQVLSEYFDNVIIIERDQADEMMEITSLEAANAANARHGVMQYNQLHALTSKGLQFYQEIFNDQFCPILVASGGHLGNAIDTAVVHHPATGLQPWLRGIPTKQPIMAAIATRHLFETTARKLVSDNPRITFKYAAAVTGLLFEEQGCSAGDDQRPEDLHKKVTGSATGVRLSDGSTVTAQLVVDCSGRGSNLPSWLAAAGYKRPRTSRISSNAGYSGWLCKLAPEVEKALDDLKTNAVLTFAGAPERTMCLTFRVEGGLFNVSVGGNEGIGPNGLGEEEVLKFASKKVWHPSAGHLLTGSTFMSPITHSYYLSSTWRHYEEIDLPDGLLVLGDAVCALNPIYGQGMTVAAMQATALSELLSRRVGAAAGAAQHKTASDFTCSDTAGTSPSSSSATCDTSSTSANSTSSTGTSNSTAWLSGLHQELQEAVGPSMQGAWALATGADLRYPTATSNEPINSSIVMKLGNAYAGEAFKMATTDPTMLEALVRVIHMLDPPESLMKPKLLMRWLLFKANSYLPASLQKTMAAAMHWHTPPQAVTGAPGGLAAAATSRSPAGPAGHKQWYSGALQPMKPMSRQL